jgi:hypothetical protein
MNTWNTHMHTSIFAHMWIPEHVSALVVVSVHLLYAVVHQGHMCCAYKQLSVRLSLITFPWFLQRTPWYSVLWGTIFASRSNVVMGWLWIFLVVVLCRVMWAWSPHCMVLEVLRADAAALCSAARSLQPRTTRWLQAFSFCITLPKDSDHYRLLD